VAVTLDGRPGYGRLRRRRIVLLVVAVLAVMASAGGLLVATTIKSPAQQAAQTKSPGLTRLTAPVRRTVIRNVVQAEGMVSKPPQVSSLTGAGGGGQVGAGSNVQQVVTKIFLRPGSFVRPGSVIIEVAGRPLFVFQGTVPAYRDLAPGETGSDVAQLQAGLAELGYSAGADASGVYGKGTAAAAAAFYRAIGYTAPVAPVAPAGHKGAREAEVPLSEIMFVPSFPARVVSLGGKLGSVASGPLATLSIGRPAIHAQLNPAYGSLVRPGMHVTITVQGSAATAHGTISSITRRAQTAKSLSGGIYFPGRPKGSGSRPAGPQIIGFVGATAFGSALKVSKAYTEALYGFSPGGGPAPRGQVSCLRLATQETYGSLRGEPDPDPVPQIAQQAVSFTQTDPLIRAAGRAWSQCMARHHYHYATPGQVEGRRWPSRRPGPRSVPREPMSRARPRPTC
jgi:peptidoglycan hydrolase-like protein with peptidoglycan-binding domain